MHEQVREYVSQFASDEPLAVLDIGGRNLNGTVRDLFPKARYTVLDIRPGAGVDIVADAATWQPDQCYDLVVCCEVFEHTDVWPGICRTAYRALRAGGRLIVTCAGPGRPPHSAIEATGITPGEFYANVAPADLHEALAYVGFEDIEVRQLGLDTQATARRGDSNGDA